MQQDLNRVIEQVSKEKGIDKSILIAALETAMVSAAKKTFGHQRKIEAQFNPEIGEVELFEAKTVVESVTDAAVEVTLNEAKESLDPDAEIGDELLCKLDSSMFGRIAAQAAKQNIVQRVRDAEREIIYNEFKGREGQLVNGIVQRFERRNIIVESRAALVKSLRTLQRRSTRVVAVQPVQFQVLVEHVLAGDIVRLHGTQDNFFTLQHRDLLDMLLVD